MNTYKEHYADFLIQLRADFDQAHKLDPSNYNPDLCKSITHCYGDMDSLEEIVETLASQKDCTQFEEGYIKVTVELEYDVDGYCEDGCIEVQRVSATLDATAIRPMTEEEFSKLLDSEYTMKRFFNTYLGIKAKDTQPKSAYTPYIDCKLIAFYRNGVIDFKALVAATYSGC